MKRCVLVVLLCCVSSVFALEGGLDLILVGPHQDPRAGEDLIIQVYFHNLEDLAHSTRAQDTMEFQWDCGRDGRRILVQGKAIDPGNFIIPPRSFAKREYRLPVPFKVSGPVKLSLKHGKANPVFFQVSSMEGAQLSGQEAEKKYYTMADKLTPYEPMYFLLGVDPGMEKSSFQLSFKYQLFNPNGELGQVAPWVDGFHFAYTQKSLWDLDSESAPFEDTSYKPELFYRFDKINLGIPWIKVFGLQAGFQHESNGRGGNDSRSTNHLYVQPFMAVHLWNEYYVSLAPKVWAYVNNSEEDNPDLADYRGYFEVDLGLGDTDGFMLNGRYRNGDKGGSVQVDLSYPLTRVLEGNVNLYFYAQYFSGYAETLLNYNERNDIFRLGFAIVR